MASTMAMAGCVDEESGGRENETLFGVADVEGGVNAVSLPASAEEREGLADDEGAWSQKPGATFIRSTRTAICGYARSKYWPAVEMGTRAAIA